MRVKGKKTNQLRAAGTRVGEWGPLLSSRRLGRIGRRSWDQSYGTVCSNYICAFITNVVRHSPVFRKPSSSNKASLHFDGGDDSRSLQRGGKQWHLLPQGCEGQSHTHSVHPGQPHLLGAEHPQGCDREQPPGNSRSSPEGQGISFSTRRPQPSSTGGREGAGV